MTKRMTNDEERAFAGGGTQASAVIDTDTCSAQLRRPAKARRARPRIYAPRGGKLSTCPLDANPALYDDEILMKTRGPL